MLYDRWRQVASQRADELALCDLASGRRWTFRQLAAAAETSSLSKGAVSFPQGQTADFVLEVLRAWRSGCLVCPLELSQAPPNFPPPPTGIVHLKTTSATTGTARLVALTAAQLMSDADHIVGTMGLRPDVPNLGVISLAHSYGFSNLVTPLLLHGLPLILAESPWPEALRKASALFPAFTLPAVPALWRGWLEAGAIPPHTRLAISAGAPLSLGLERQIFISTGIKVHNFYGSSECGGIAYDDSAKPREHEDCAGAPLQNVNLALTAEGCLEVRSRAVAETYWPEPAPNLGAGRYQTGDLAELKDGQVFLRGRLSDQINVAGRKVFPETIETCLRRHPAVQECVVFGAPSPQTSRAESIVACVAARSRLTGQELRDFLLTELAPWQVPRDWWFVNDLQVNDRGKLSRAEWRARFLQQRTATSAPT